MSIWYYPLAAMAGGVIGSILHETAHALAAWSVGELEGVGWHGSFWTGAPHVDFRANSRLGSEIVRKAPLVLGIVLLVPVAASAAPTPRWMLSAGIVLGLLRGSREDLFIAAAEREASA